MTRKQAINLYLKHSVHAEPIIRRLMVWNPNLSLTDNAKNFKQDVDNRAAGAIAKKYGLGYIDGRKQ